MCVSGTEVLFEISADNSSSSCLSRRGLWITKNARIRNVSVLLSQISYTQTTDRVLMIVTMAKEERFQIRATAEQRALLERASAITGNSLSSFMLSASIREAEETILDQRIFTLDDEAFERQLAQFTQAPNAKARLEKLLSRKSSWES